MIGGWIVKRRCGIIDDKHRFSLDQFKGEIFMQEINGKYFDWDNKKNLANIEKHGVSFKMAATSFFDPEAVTIDDDTHSQQEDRFILIGVNKYDKLLTVCHCYRDNDNVIRIISARKPNQLEREIYGGEM